MALILGRAVRQVNEARQKGSAEMIPSELKAMAPGNGSSACILSASLKVQSRKPVDLNFAKFHPEVTEKHSR